MTDERVDAKAAEEEAQAEAAGEHENVLADENVTVEDLPSVEDKNVNVLANEDVDPNVGWTNQHALDDRGEDRETFVNPSAAPGQYVPQHQLPTKEGLAASGVADPESYLAGVPVRK